MPAGWLDKLSTRALRNTAVLLGAVLAVSIVALVLSLGARFDQVPQVARTAAKQQAALVAREQADRRSGTTLRRGLLAACNRNNSVYRYYNHQTAHEYRTATRAYQANLATYAALSYVGHLQLAVSHIRGPARGRQKRHRVERRVGHKILRAARYIKGNANASEQSAAGMQYLPLTDCVALVKHPDTYRPPATISWAHHLADERVNK